MPKEDDDSGKDVLTAGKKEKLEEGPEKEGGQEDRGRERDEQDYGQYPPPPGGYPPPPPQQPSEPMLTPKKLHRFMAIGVLIGILILFVGTLLIVSANYMDPDEETDTDDRDNARDLQRNIATSGRLIDGIGLFLMGLFIVLPLMIIRDLSDKQRTMLVLILVAVIIGFSFLSLGFVYL